MSVSTHTTTTTRSPTPHPPLPLNTHLPSLLPQGGPDATALHTTPPPSKPPASSAPAVASHHLPPNQGTHPPAAPPSRLALPPSSSRFVPNRAGIGQRAGRRRVPTARAAVPGRDTVGVWGKVEERVCVFVWGGGWKRAVAAPSMLYIHAREQRTLNPRTLPRHTPAGAPQQHGSIPFSVASYSACRGFNHRCVSGSNGALPSCGGNRSIWTVNQMHAHVSVSERTSV